MASKTSTGLIVFYVLGMLLTGTVNTLTTKIQFTMTSVGLHGPEVFAKPWFGTLNMLTAMMLVGIVDWLVRTALSSMRTKSSAVAPLLDQSPKKGPAKDPAEIGYYTKVCYVAIPAAFDLFATAFCCMGILYIPASVWQMLRGASIIFAAVFSITCLGRKMYAFNWIGLCICVIGVCLVGLANVWGGSEDDSNANSKDAGELILGMSLVVAGQIVQAAQVIAEEWLMKDVDLPAMQIIGYEGFWGALMMVLIVYPLLWVLPGQDNGHQEDIVDTYVMLLNSGPLMWIVVTYLISCGTFNATGIQVTSHLSAVHRMMLDASRTTVIWAFGLTVGYMHPDSLFGEQWTPYSPLQLVGFVVLVFGQATYGEVVRLPGLYYPPPKPFDAAQFASPGALNLSSPLPREA